LYESCTAPLSIGRDPTPISRGTSIAIDVLMGDVRQLRGAAGLLGVVCAVATCGGVPPVGGIATVKRAVTVDDSGAMMAADGLRTGWYASEPLLDPTIVGSPYFGQIFNAAVVGQIYAQPLYAAGVVFVATEANWIYGLEPSSGTVLWSRQLATPWNVADVNCGDLTPTIGVSGTPAIDVATGTAYLLSKTYASGTSGPAAWYAHAIDLATGAERAGFPVVIAGAASNEPAQVFDPTRQMQRPGMLFMDGVAYAAFGAHCDSGAYTGWIVGISPQGSIKTMWATESGPTRTNGGGIWQAGGGLVSDGAGQIIFATGNDWSAASTPVPGHTPPGHLGESVVRVTVQANGTLAATDFFAPAELTALNYGDLDLGSGAPVALPASFGTTAHPNLLLQAGKSGYLYVMDRADLGGFMQGASGSDHVLQRLGPYGGVWSKPSVWPGDGGYVYVPVSNACTSSADPSGCLRAYQYGASGDGTPALAAVATSNNSFGYGSSAVVVTSNGTLSGSALLWTIWSSGTAGATSQLRAYDAVPTDGVLTLKFLSGIGQSAKFTSPAVGDGRLFVGTRDGHVLGFGLSGAPPLRAQGVAFAPTVVGGSVESSVVLTATTDVQVLALDLSGDFVLAEVAPDVPFTIANGDSVTIPVVFRPLSEGPSVGSLQTATADGSFAVSLSGVGLSPTPQLTAVPALLTFPPAVVGASSAQTVSITNVSGTPLTISGLAAPAAPFSVTGLPALGTVIAPGDWFTATITFSPATLGSSAGYLGIAAGGAVAAVAIEGAALGGGKLRLEPTSLALGQIYVGESMTTTFTLTNTGDSPVVLEKSKPPTTAAFQAQSPFNEGMVIAAGATVQQTIVVAPQVAGPASDVWQLNADDGQGLRLLTMSVTGLESPSTAPEPVTSASDSLAYAPASPEGSAEPAMSTPALADGCAVGGGAPSGSLAALAWILAVTRARRWRARG
jgi:outer membrane protein assembly factor BamB